MIFLVLNGRTLEDNLRQTVKYQAVIDGAELRADFLTEPEAEDWEGFFRRAGGLPLILTLRKPSDGGRRIFSEDRRRELFLRLIGKGTFRYVDLEEDASFPDVEAAARNRGAGIIRSFHDFSGVPENLVPRLRSLCRNPGDIPKAAVMPKSCADLERLIDAFACLRDTRKILIGMGEYGFATRVLAPRLGSFLTFACSGEDAAAPGLIDPETLDRVYRYHAQGPSTRIFGIIGKPILHSRSPHIHGAGYSQAGIDGVYVPFHIDKAADFLPLIRKLDIGGLSVTAPFKEEAMSLCAELEEAARIIGACNTLVPRPGGLRGYNTDAEGFLAPLRQLGASASGGGLPARASVIGAGGAARSAVYALAKEGVSVLVLNRSPERARRLTGDMGRALGLAPGFLGWAALDSRGLARLEENNALIVNATTMGMHPWENLDPLAGREFRGKEIVYDMVYSPRETLFLKRAAAAGCKVIYGEQMLLNQAYRQFYLYTGKNLEG
jgi:3-dehydroquinate dehydratase/shikimate dehydrogenase